MDIRNFKEKSISEQKTYLFSTLDAENGTRIDEVRNQLFGKGHVLSAHYGLSSEELLHRTISEIKSVSCFESTDDAISFVESSLYEEENATKIVKWLNEREARPLEIDMNDMGEIVGTGVDINLKEKETCSLKIILQKDFDYLNEFGFYVKTAYPNIDSKEATFTGKDYKEDVKNIIKDESNELCRGFWGLRINGFVPHISYKNAENKINVYAKTKEYNYALCISQYTAPIIVQSEIKNPENSKLFRNKYDLDLPLEIQTWAEKAIDTYEEYRKDKNINAQYGLTDKNAFYHESDCER